MTERKLEKLIAEHVEKIKSLLEQMPEKRFDFKFEDDYYAVVIDEEDFGLDVGEFLIYSGSSWAGEDELIPTSVYLDNEEGELMFDVHYREYDDNGDFWDEKDLTEIPYSQIEYRNFSTTKKKVLEWGLNRIIYVIENTKA